MPPGTSGYGSYIPSFTRPMFGGERNYEMPTSLIEVSTFSKNMTSVFSPYHRPGPMGNQFGHPTELRFPSKEMPTFTTSYAAIMRQQMDESNHEMVNMLTQQIGAILRPLIQSLTQSYQQLDT
ncbi:unnamed protein product [Vicia faba]|uniref:Uncharacterized protein n=1 Tax=Vicia faba TaxID=3906 RepID=A0AAV0Z3G9_VICFA|nr:unnamed protein product [Vicia faba]